jgi:hypothetical protein
VSGVKVVYCDGPLSVCSKCAISAPDEAWHTITLFNEYLFDFEQDTFISDTGAKIQLTVRNAGTEAEPSWKLVEWRDLDESGALAVSSQFSTEPRSWGEIKSLYLP